MMSLPRILIAASFASSAIQAFSPPASKSPILQQKNNMNIQETYDPLNFADLGDKTLLTVSGHDNESKNKSLWMGALMASSAVATCPSAAHAATAFTSNVIPSALGAYGHYLSLVGLVACTMGERLTIKAGMTKEEEDFVALLDIMLGVFGVLITYTGYLRLTQFEKGWDFYSHEPIFWVKMCFLAIYGASTFFNTTIIIQRAVARQSGVVPPMTEKMATRMHKICNAGLVALALMPAAATFMARGVLYNQDIPWQLEAAVVAILFGGLGFKYVKEALDFEDEPVAISSD